MTAPARRIVVVAYAHARLTAYLVAADRAGMTQLVQLLDGLRTLGRVAWYTVQLQPGWSGVERTVDAIAGAVGRLAVEAVLGSPPTRPDAAPAWLMPVWPFDHRIGDRPASTADLMGMTLQLRGIPSGDEEQGVALPGWPGRWLIDASTITART